MKNNNRCGHLLFFFAGAFILSITASANAALVSRLGGQAVYDTDLNITWLADANLAATNTFGVSDIVSGGYMNWNAAQNWIGAMNATNYLGYNDWRLPTTPQTDPSCQYDSYSGYFSCTGSEMGHLFYNELGGVASSSVATIHNANYSLFSNVKSFVYWSGTEYALDTAGAWVFNFDDGSLSAGRKDIFNFNTWAVRTGDVATVPVQSAAWLLCSGLAGLASIARKRKAL